MCEGGFGKGICRLVGRGMVGRFLGWLMINNETLIPRGVTRTGNGACVMWLRLEIGRLERGGGDDGRESTVAFWDTGACGLEGGDDWIWCASCTVAGIGGLEALHN